MKRLFLLAAAPLALLIYGHALDAPYYLDDPGVLESGRRVYLDPRGVPPVAGLWRLTLALGWSLSDLLGPVLCWESSVFIRLIGVLLHVLTATIAFALRLWLALIEGVFFRDGRPFR